MAPPRFNHRGWMILLCVAYWPQFILTFSNAQHLIPLTSGKGPLLAEIDFRRVNEKFVINVMVKSEISIRNSVASIQLIKA
jgi:hypothetical protein